MVLHWPVLEAASWRLASQLHRRHPHLLLFRGHPGGGQYDVLWLRSSGGADVRLNRRGTIQVLGRHDGSDPSWEPVEWVDYLQEDPRVFLQRLERAAGLDATGPTPLGTPAVLVHRLISALAALHALGEPLSIEQGYIDTSGYGGGPAEWLRSNPSVPAAMLDPAPGDPNRQPGYRFWRVTASRLEVMFETGTGSAWGSQGGALLTELYARGGRDIDQTVATVLALARNPQ